MDLKEYCHSITTEKLFGLAIKVCEAALPIWWEYSANNELTYRDTVVGLRHEVDSNLLQNSVSFCKGEIFESAAGNPILIKLLEKFSDPIVALQDSDWELPYPVERVFYAVYNLLDGLRNRVSYENELVHYVSVNQAVDAPTEGGLMSFEEIKEIIYPGLSN
jgi:hypothetical protein